VARKRGAPATLVPNTRYKAFGLELHLMLAEQPSASAGS